MLWLLGCPDPAPAPVDSDVELPVVETEDTTPPVETQESTPWVDTTPPYEPVVTIETIGDQEMSNDHVFDEDVLHEINITIPHSSWAALLNSPYTYMPARAEIDGEYFGDVGVRLRGKIGSFRVLTDKPKMRVDLNQYVQGQRYYGLESVSLNNSVVDCSYMKEVVASEVFEHLDVPASRAAWTRVTVNEMDYGTYVLLESVDDAFLRQKWADGTGNLYDGKYVWYGGYNYTLLDFGIGVDHLFQLEEGTDVNNSDIHAISTALSSGSFYSETDKVVDWEKVHRTWAATQWLGQNDGYVLNRNNYRIYFDPADDKAEWIPWDFDYSFLQDYQWGRSWSNPTGTLAYACRYDSSCVADWRTAADDVLTELNTVDWETRTEEMAEFLEDTLSDDPKKACNDTQIEQWQSYVQAWTTQRPTYMKQFWGI